MEQRPEQQRILSEGGGGHCSVTTTTTGNKLGYVFLILNIGLPCH